MELKGAKIKWTKVKDKSMYWGKVGNWTHFIIDLDTVGAVLGLRNFLGDTPVLNNRPGSLTASKRLAQKLLHEHIIRLEERIVLLST